MNLFRKMFPHKKGSWDEALANFIDKEKEEEREKTKLELQIFRKRLSKNKDIAYLFFVLGFIIGMIFLGFIVNAEKTRRRQAISQAFSQMGNSLAPAPKKSYTVLYDDGYTSNGVPKTELATIREN